MTPPPKKEAFLGLAVIFGGIISLMEMVEADNDLMFSKPSAGVFSCFQRYAVHSAICSGRSNCAWANACVHVLMAAERPENMKQFPLGIIWIHWIYFCSACAHKSTKFLFLTLNALNFIGSGVHWQTGPFLGQRCRIWMYFLRKECNVIRPNKRV